MMICTLAGYVQFTTRLDHIDVDSPIHFATPHFASSDSIHSPLVSVQVPHAFLPSVSQTPIYRYLHHG